MKRTIEKVNAGSYNDFCAKLRGMMIYDVTVRVANTRNRFIDNITGNVVAEYDERKDHGIVYNYHTNMTV